MVAVFVRLKLRLLRNGLRLGWQQKVGILVGAVYAVPLAFGGFAVLAAGRANPGLGASATTLVFMVLFMGWLVAPLLGFGSDETLDPGRLALLPLPRRQLAVGLFGASCVGIGAAATAVVLAGTVVGMAPPGAGAVVVVAAVAVQLCLCIAGGRALATALSGALRSRRGRDLTAVVTVLAAVVVPQSFRLFGGVERSQLDTLAAALTWTPPGLAAKAVIEARAGEALPALAALAGSAAVAGALVWWWMVGLDRSLTTAPVTGPSSRRRAPPELFARAWAWLPRDRRGAVAAKELRYYLRDPRQRAGTLVWFLFAAALLIGVVVGGVERPEIVLAAAAFALLVGLAGINQYGFEGGAHWMNVVSGTDVRSDLVGKNLALAAFGLALVAVEAIALAVVTGGWAWVPATVAIAVAILGVVLGVGNVFSARAPQPAPPSTTNLFATNTGQGCTAGLLQMLAMLVQAVLLIPVVVAVAVPVVSWPPALALTTPLAMAYGWVCWRTGLAHAVRWLSPRQTELLETLSVRRAG